MQKGISIIICSIDEKLRNSIVLNITETIGVPFEVIIHDNLVDNQGICSVYNKHIENAKYPFLCLIHEDIIIHTKNWGDILIKQAELKNTGIIGFAGTQTISQYPYAWWSADSLSNKINLIQGRGQDSLNWKNEAKEAFTSILVLDGFFLFFRKELVKEFRFDEKTFPYFHYYDIDFSFQVTLKYSNYVCNIIDVQHLSIGNVGNDWFNAAQFFCEKWKHELPKSLSEEAYHRLATNNRNNFYWHIRLMVLNTSLGGTEIYKRSKKMKDILFTDYSNIKLLFNLIRFYFLKNALRIYHFIFK